MEANSSDETQDLRAPRLHCMDAAASEGPFTPLRLILQPSGLVVDLNRPDMVMGRHSQADVRVALPDVSRRHCRFFFEAGQWHLCDLNSLNGTFINGQRMHEAALGQGDQIRVGELLFSVDFEVIDRHSETAADIIRSIVDVLPSPVRKAS